MPDMVGEAVDRLITIEAKNRGMPHGILQPMYEAARQAAGNKPKRIEEFAGRVNSGHANVSIARMTSPQGWLEPGQRPDFQEVTVVLRGMVRVEFEGGALDVRAGQAVVFATFAYWSFPFHSFQKVRYASDRVISQGIYVN